MPMMVTMRLRPRQEFPTQLFKLTVSLFVVVVAALLIYLAIA
jgi:hypothetical protein